MSDGMEVREMNPISVPFLHAEAIDDTEILQDQRQRSEEIVQNNDQGWGASWANRCGSWNSVDIYDNILEEEEVYSPILDNIATLIQQFTDMMRMDWSDMTPVVTESWLNANPPGNVQECHIHPHCYISAVYYIHIPDGDGSEFVLDNPLSYEHTVGCSQESPYTDKVFDVSSGDLILFPSNIDHHTRVNKSDEYRYSLAFNITTQELLPEYKTGEENKPWKGE